MRIAATSAACLALLFSTGSAHAEERAASGAAPTRGWIGDGRAQRVGASPNVEQPPTTEPASPAVCGSKTRVFQPIFDLGWSHVVGPEENDIDVFRAGVKLAIGMPVAHGAVWVGGAAGVALQAGWLHTSSNTSLPTTSPGVVFDATSSSQSSIAWAVAPSFSGLVQGRVARRLLLGADLGFEDSIPALKWGSVSVFNALRLQLGVQIGVILGDAL